MSFSQKTNDFYRKLSLSVRLPIGIEAMNPYREDKVSSYVETFLKSFYSDSNERVFVFGINPGRFGAGLTGIAFTDPVAFQDFCGVKNDLQKKRELSSEFVYSFINQWGGVRKFFEKFFLTAVSPLGFVRQGKNYNYYDDRELLNAVEPFILDSLKEQISIGASRKAAIVLGGGKNFEFLSRLNKENGFFQKILPLDHPRYIMQYKRKHLARYLDEYQKVFSEALI